MIWYNDLFTTSDRLTRSLVTFFMHATFTYKSLGGLLMKEKANPHCADSNLRLHKLMEACVPLGLSLTKKLCCIFQSRRTALALFPPYLRTKTRLGAYPGLILKRRAPLQT